MLPHLLVIWIFRYGGREGFREKGAPRSGVGVGWHRVQIGRVMRSQELVCTVALAKSSRMPVRKATRKIAARCCGPWQYVDRLSRTYGEMRIVQHDAETPRVSWIASGATQHADHTHRVPRADISDIAWRMFDDRLAAQLPEGRGVTDPHIARSVSDRRR
jgi:hypothetical protein